MTETKVSKAAVRRAAETGLQKAAAAWIVRRMDDYESGAEGVLKDLFYGGCVSGMVGELVYYADTAKFYEKHKEDIWALAIEQAEEFGNSNAFDFLKGLNLPAPGDYMQVANNLAWFGFEEAARQIANKLELDV